MNTTSAEFFEAKYQQSEDPWHFASNGYELERYAAILRALAPARYRHAFEPACSIGVLTAKLATICDRVEASDISATAVAHASQRCAALGNVTVGCASLSESIPASCDLLVFSEIGYYFHPSKLRTILAECITHLEANGTLLACHWLGHSSDHIMSGDETHAIIASMPQIHLEHSERHPDFRLDRWRKLPEAPQ
jgi:hypothetical protein